jgi:transporter family-2 protein
MTWLLVLLALAMGASSAVQGATNGTLAGRTSLASAVLVNATVVFVGAAGAWLLARRPLTSEPSSPWWLYAGGCYGLFIIAGAAFAFPRLGAGPTTALMVAAQLGAALLLDHFGLSGGKVPVTPTRLLGVALLFAGALLVLWPKLFPDRSA